MIDQPLNLNVRHHRAKTNPFHSAVHRQPRAPLNSQAIFAGTSQRLEQHQQTILVAGSVRSETDAAPVGGVWIVEAQSKVTAALNAFSEIEIQLSRRIGSADLISIRKTLEKDWGAPVIVKKKPNLSIERTGLRPATHVKR
ncbi:MAG: hypothetical protein HHJ12_07740 [Glaciimonas sp.]|nr:hypothetical protein [Glaciimonas sp.]